MFIHQHLLKKLDLACLKSKIDKLDIGKLKTFLVNLSKLSNVIINENVIKRLCMMN